VCIILGVIILSVIEMSIGMQGIPV
jgi:hypothetical protein